MVMYHVSATSFIVRQLSCFRYPSPPFHSSKFDVGEHSCKYWHVQDLTHDVVHEYLGPFVDLDMVVWMLREATG